jgi:hypothetical protein
MFLDNVPDNAGSPAGEPDEEPAPEETGEDLIPEGFVVETGEGRSLADVPPAEEDDVSPPEEREESIDLSGVPPAVTNELRTVLSYMDHLLESLPEEKIEEFARSEYFDTYKKLFKELGIG